MEELVTTTREILRKIDYSIQFKSASGGGWQPLVSYYHKESRKWIEPRKSYETANQAMLFLVASPEFPFKVRIVKRIFIIIPQEYES